MAEVSVEINGRKFRMACEDGEEEHLSGLANRFNSMVEQFKGSFGEIGDNRLTVMAGIAVLDDLVEAERKIDALNAEMVQVKRDSQAVSDEANALELRFSRRLAETARKIEAVATVIDETATGSENPA